MIRNLLGLSVLLLTLFVVGTAFAEGDDKNKEINPLINLVNKGQTSKQEQMDAGWNRGLEAFDRGNFTTALKEFRPLAEQGDAKVQAFMGAMYRQGQGVPQDFKLAIKWFTLAAEQGIVEAQSDLGLMYKLGIGVTQDYKMAVKWYTLAAKQGFVLAQSKLGLMYLLGQGVPQDHVFAHMWLSIAASTGYKDAVKGRDIVAKLISPSDVSKAQNLAKQCLKNKYKGC